MSCLTGAGIVAWNILRAIKRPAELFFVIPVDECGLGGTEQADDVLPTICCRMCPFALEELLCLAENHGASSVKLDYRW